MDAMETLQRSIEASAQMYDLSESDVAFDVATLLTAGVDPIDVLSLGSDVEPWPFAVAAEVQARGVTPRIPPDLHARRLQAQMEAASG